MGMSFLLFLVIFICSPWGLEPVLAEALQEPRRTFHIDYQAQWAIIYHFSSHFTDKLFIIFN